MVNGEESADYTPVIFNFAGHESYCFPQVSENKAFLCLAPKGFMIVIF